MNKIGIMGGTFNPIHYGHLFLAEEAYEQIGLDQILFMPSNHPPHKKNSIIVSDEHRASMVSLAIAKNHHFKLSIMELEREGLTYTADTLTILAKNNPDIDYHFIIGADSLFAIMDWMKPKTIFELCTLVVASRDHVDLAAIEAKAQALRDEFGARIKIVNMPTIEISSASIRDRLASKKSIRYYVPDDVIDYISMHHLYEGVPKE